MSTDQTRVYHVRETRLLDSILRDGLKPMIGPRSRSAGEDTPVIYVFPDSVSLIDGLTNWLGDELDMPCSILELTVPDDWLIHDDVRWECRITRAVPASHLRVVVPDVDTWDGRLEDEVLPAD
jgi:hypothetical protein